MLLAIKHAHTRKMFDNNIMINIARNSSDPTNVLRAVGSKSFFDDARTFDVIKDISYETFENSVIDIYFEIPNEVSAAESAVIENVRYMFPDSNILSYSKTYADIVKNSPTKYVLLIQNTPSIIEGFKAFDSVKAYGYIKILDDVRIANTYYQKKDLTAPLMILELLKGVKICSKKYKYAMFYITYDSLIKHIGIDHE